MYLPTLFTLDTATPDDVLNEASNYLEIAINTLAMIHDSEPDNSHLKPIFQGLESHLFNTNALIQCALERIAAVQTSEVSL